MQKSTEVKLGEPTAAESALSKSAGEVIFTYVSEATSEASEKVGAMLSYFFAPVGQGEGQDEEECYHHEQKVKDEMIYAAPGGHF